MLDQQSIKKPYPLILKLQFEICLEVGHNFKLFWYNIFIKKSETNYLLSPTIRLALTVPSRTIIVDVNIVDTHST